MTEKKVLPTTSFTGLVRVKKNYTPLAQSSIFSSKVSIGELLDAHKKIQDLGGGAAASGGELVGPWYAYKELTEGASVSQEQIKVLVESGVINREVTLRELITTGQDFSGPTLAAGGELVGPWYVLKEGSNAIETLGEIR
ncbi:MAG: hypothetical protein ACJAU1_001642 [Psychromonas sp.]|jgi:hypothetical protein